MAKPKNGRLGSDDLALWAKVKKTANPLHQSIAGQDHQPSDVSENPPAPSNATQKFKPKPFRIGQAVTAVHQSPSAMMRLAPTMDAKAFSRLKRGKLRPEARIDLHGMTQDRALPALTTFIQDSASRGLRLVLVITGKGRPRPDFGPIPERPGILRRNVPIWLRSGALASYVLEVTESHRSHGGEGAYYVYLRRLR